MSKYFRFLISVKRLKINFTRIQFTQSLSFRQNCQSRSRQFSWIVVLNVCPRNIQNRKPVQNFKSRQLILVKLTTPGESIWATTVFWYTYRRLANLINIVFFLDVNLQFLAGIAVHGFDIY